MHLEMQKAAFASLKKGALNSVPASGPGQGEAVAGEGVGIARQLAYRIQHFAVNSTLVPECVGHIEPFDWNQEKQLMAMPVSEDSPKH